MTDNNEHQAPEISQPEASVPAPDAFIVPEAYKGKGWVEKVKSSDDLWKTLDNAQSLLGKRPAGIPSADAPDADWDAFYSTARPESADKYAFSDIEGLPEGTDLTATKEFAKKLMFDAGVPPKQAEKIWQQYWSAEIESAGKRSEQRNEQLDKVYAESLTKAFGDKGEAYAKEAQAAIKAILPPELSSSIEALKDHPEALVSTIAIAKAYEDKFAKLRADYGAEGNLPNGGTQAAAIDIGETVTKLAKLRLSPEAADFTKPGHKKIMDEISALQAVVARHYN